MISGQLGITRHLAPAKLNLGLEIVQRRDDGFHDIATLFLTISLCDVLEITDTPELRVSAPTLPIPQQENLIWRAAVAVQALAKAPGASIAAHKVIPAASGLGGASSDAAATLLALQDRWDVSCSDAELAEFALQLGSDVPFFLCGGCALGQGRGEQLTPLPAPEQTWFVLVVPKLLLPRKTASLYAALRPEDFSSGARVLAQARQLTAHRNLDDTLLANGFARALYALAPELAEIPAIMRAAGARKVSISGAGPTHYAVFPDPGAANSTADILRARLRPAAQVFVVEPGPGRYD